MSKDVRQLIDTFYVFKDQGYIKHTGEPREWSIHADNNTEDDLFVQVYRIPRCRHTESKFYGYKHCTECGEKIKETIVDLAAGGDDE